MNTIRHSHYNICRHRHASESAGAFRIAVLADLHNQVYRSDTRSLIKAVRDEKCDAVLSAGDLVLMTGGHFATDQARVLVSALAAEVPVFLCDGNHETKMKRFRPQEYQAYDESMKNCGAVCVHNDSADAELGGVKVRITGLELDYRYFRNRYRMRLDEGSIKALVGESRRDRFQILLAHHPKYFGEYANWGADLVLSGHLHGGIVRLPFLGGAVSPDPSLLPHYDHGLYESGISRMIVSAGLGTHTINIRINNPAELVIADITLN